MAQQKVFMRVVTRGQVGAQTSRAVRELQQTMPHWDIDEHQNAMSVAVARNEVCRMARDARADYCIMVDDDVIFNNGIVKLPLANKPVVSGLVPTWQAGYFFWNAFDIEDSYFRSIDLRGPEGLREVFAVGAAILCIRRDVLENEDLWPLFFLHTFPDGTMRPVGGEDTAFCAKCQEHGIPIHVDMQCQGEHWRDIGLKQTLVAIQENRQNPDFSIPSRFDCDVRTLPFEVKGWQPFGGLRYSPETEGERAEFVDGQFQPLKHKLGTGS